MDGPSRTINPACVRSRRAQASKGLGKNVQVSSSPTTILLSQNLGTHCREWPAAKASAEVQMLVEANSKPHDMIYTKSQGTGLVGGSRSSRLEGLCTKTVDPTESRPIA